MDPLQFSSRLESHAHALKTLDELYEYDDFMMSIDTLIDIGCGPGIDLEWWASRTTRDENNPEPLNIKCTGIDLFPSLKPAKVYKPDSEITYIEENMEDATWIVVNEPGFDVIWCHDAFQFAIDPLGTLGKFNTMLSNGGMLALMIPQSTNVIFHKQEFNQFDGVFYNHTLVSLIHMLAVNGFDCKSGFFKKDADDAWLSAIVYKSEHKPMDPRSTRWYDLVEKGLLPDSADASVNKAGFLRQPDLVLPWLNKSMTDFSRH